MSTAITEYKQYIKVFTKWNDTPYYLPKDWSNKVYEAMNLWKPIIMPNWDIISWYQIERAITTMLDELDEYVVSVSDRLQRQRLIEIIEERKSKKLNIAWVDHLIQIYDRRYSSHKTTNNVEN